MNMMRKMGQAATATEATEDVTAPPAKKARRESKPRPPARPFKRLPEDVLLHRITDMEKKASVLRSKLVLLEDRHSEHQKERATRQAEGTMSVA